MNQSARRTLSQANIEARRLTGRFRPLPDFLIIGAQKSGTSSLFAYLKQHPRIDGSIRKEVNYFTNGSSQRRDGYARGENWYRAHFPLFNRLRGPRLAFEATPAYLPHPQAPARIASDLPGVKLIAVLRDPVERAVSHYFHRFTRGQEPLPIMDAFLAERSRDAAFAPGTFPPGFQAHAYLARGEYAAQLERYFALFPRERMMVIESSALYRDTQATLASVFAFLGVEPFTVGNLEPVLVGKGKTPVAPEVYDYLRAHFRPHNERLFDLMGTRYPWQ